MAEKQPLIVIKKGGGGHGGHHGGAWKVAFADFMTALMAFFMVMWLMGSDDEVKSAASEYFNNPGSGSPIPLAAETGSKSELDPMKTKDAATGGVVHNLPTGRMSSQDSLDEEMISLKERLQQSISLDLGVSDPSHDVQMAYDSEGLVLKITAKNFFDHGQSKINEDLKPLLLSVGKILKPTNRIIRVIGHADSTEKNASQFSDAWMLSAARAKEVVSYWERLIDIDPKRIEVVGQSYYRSIASSDTTEGRASNRRIEILIPSNEFKKK